MTCQTGQLIRPGQVPVTGQMKRPDLHYLRGAPGGIPRLYIVGKKGSGNREPDSQIAKKNPPGFFRKYYRKAWIFLFFKNLLQMW